MKNVFFLMFFFIGFQFTQVAYGQTYTTQSKSCGSCGKAVSNNSQVGMRCPHCGVVWGRENTKTTTTYRKDYSSKYDNYSSKYDNYSSKYDNYSSNNSYPTSYSNKYSSSNSSDYSSNNILPLSYSNGYSSSNSSSGYSSSNILPLSYSNEYSSGNNSSGYSSSNILPSNYDNEYLFKDKRKDDGWKGSTRVVLTEATLGSSPSSTSYVITKLYAPSFVTVIEKEGEWCYVSYYDLSLKRKFKGYIHSSLLN